VLGAFLLRFEPVKAAAAGQWERDLILQVGEVEHGRIRHIRPRNQVGALLQREICGWHRPRQREFGGRRRESQLR